MSIYTYQFPAIYIITNHKSCKVYIGSTKDIIARQYGKTYYIQNSEKIKEKNKKYYYINNEEVLKKQKEYGKK